MSRSAMFLKNTAVEIPHRLKFNSSNNDLIGTNSLLNGGLRVYSGAFYVEAKFEYSSLSSSYAPIFGALGNGGFRSFRVLVGSTTTLVTMTNNTNLSYSKATSTNTIYTIKIRRDSSDNIWVSYDGGSETNIGSRSGDVGWRCMASGSNSRYLNGKIYWFDLNGEMYNCNEGSGNTVSEVTKSLTIETSNVGGLTYINSTMWEII